MLTKRIIPCLDVANGRVGKGTQFQNLKDVGDPVELARLYYKQGADELVFLDITATIESRKTMVDIVERVSREIFIPFTVGGGVQSVEDIGALLNAGADKVAINTAAVENPRLITEAAERFGSQAIVVAVDIVQSAKLKVKSDKSKCKWKVVIRAGSQKTDLDAIAWAKRAEKLGAGEILLTSIDRDGTRSGYDLELLAAVSSAVTIPVIASGGVGSVQDFSNVFQKTEATGALAAGVFHEGAIDIYVLKKFLQQSGINIRL